MKHYLSILALFAFTASASAAGAQSTIGKLYELIASKLVGDVFFEDNCTVRIDTQKQDLYWIDIPELNIAKTIEYTERDGKRMVFFTDKPQPFDVTEHGGFDVSINTQKTLSAFMFLYGVCTGDNESF